MAGDSQSGEPSGFVLLTPDNPFWLRGEATQPAASSGRWAFMELSISLRRENLCVQVPTNFLHLFLFPSVHSSQ